LVAFELSRQGLCLTITKDDWSHIEKESNKRNYEVYLIRLYKLIP
jgi:hypothetical protein